MDISGPLLGASDLSISWMYTLLTTSPLRLGLFDEDLHCLALNFGLADLSPLPADDQVGRMLAELLPTLCGAIEPCVRQVLATGAPLADVPLRGETPTAPGATQLWRCWCAPVPRSDGPPAVSISLLDVSPPVPASEIELLSQPLATLVPIGVFKITPDDLCAFANERWRQMTGASSETVSEHPWTVVVRPEDRAVVEAEWRQARSTGAVYNAQVPLLAADGQVRWAAINAAPLAAEHEQQREYLATALDITEQKLAEDALRLSEQRYRLLFENSIEAVLLANDQGIYIDVNQAATRLFGIERSELIGSSVARFQTVSGPDAATRYADYIRRGYEEGEFDFVRPDGERRIAQYLATRVGPGLHQSVLRDITAQVAALKALEESQHFINKVITTLPHLIYVYDVSQHKTVYLNRELSSLLGDLSEPSMEITLYSMDRFTHPDDLVVRHTSFAALLAAADGEIIRQSYRIRHSSGEWRWMEVRSTVFVRDDEGRVTQVLGTLIDISEQKRVIEALTLSEERYRLITENSTDLVQVIELDEPHICTYASPSHGTVLGIDPQQMLGPITLDNIHPQDRHLARAALRQLAADGDIHIVLRMGTPSGPYRWVETHGRHITSTMNSQQRLAVLVGRDVTARRVAEDALAASERRFRALVELAPVGIFECDPQGACTFVNDRWQMIAGISAEQAMGDGWLVSLHPDDRERVYQAWMQTASSGQEYNVDIRYQHPDGRIFWTVANGTPVRDSSGTIISYIGTVFDITPHKEVERKLQASLGEKEVLLKEIHHRVKNNLQVIASLLRMQSYSISDLEVRELFRESQNRVRAMALIHEQLYGTEDLTYIDVSAYLHRLAMSVAQSYEGRGVAIALTFDIEPAITATIDIAIPLGLILTELISNSLKHAFGAGQAGTITVKVASGEHELRLTVHDTGVGIPIAFDPSRVTTLGIQLILNLVEQHQGVFTIERAGGTLVRVTLPTSLHAAERGVV